MESRQLFEYIYERVAENVAGKDDLTHYELGMLYQCGADFVAVAEIDIVLMEWFELGAEPYFDDLLAGVPPEFRVDDAGDNAHFYSDDGTLEENLYEARWDRFVEDVRYTHRFFNTGTVRFLDSVFSLLSTDEKALKPEVIRTITHGEMLYRARNTQNQKQAEEIIENPGAEFGPTPRHLASSQRMTPNGISALYCALERETCLSEIRSITGDHVISVALTPITELKLLDLTVLDRVAPPALTLLDEGCREVLHRQVFLGSLVRKLSRPKARNDELSYLSTQVVFEYLRLQFGKQVDGLVFPSVQTGQAGTNVVLFPEASQLASLPQPANDAADEEGDGVTAALVIIPLEVDNPFDPRAKLQIVAKSIRFHKITAIQTSAREYRYISDLFMSDLNRRRLGPAFQ
ncbi:RES family NAD+ phosphorylase [Pseudomonas chlororaphis]|uniref:RES family NAD+ phosphorylase n=1 Tax=Pseudomonas chlororaphis TaxID=587753 RepID=UPI001F151214|nr:RES family NAD+ phosphorylase [Pseudomonas chlororaphis]